MSDTVYVLGAGVSQVIKDKYGLSPPLINNFFQIALKNKHFNNELYIQNIQVVYDYIKKYWKKDIKILSSECFNLEECFTLLDLHLDDAISSNDNKKIEEFDRVRFRLKSFFAEFLSHFKIFKLFDEPLPIMEEFGKILYEQKPIIITFNYDTIIEQVLENAAGSRQPIPPGLLSYRFNKQKKIPDEIISFSPSNWNKPLGYAIEFDKVQLTIADKPLYIEGEEFYSLAKNQLYEWYILKLHGSINWFRYLKIPSTDSNVKFEASYLEKKIREIILVEGTWWFNNSPSLDGLLIDPFIITPILYKEKYFRWIPYKSVFSILWDKAKEALSKCKKLIIIGYSFAPTDFLTKKMFLEAFSENDLDELIVVNPDTSVVQKVKDLCHFNKPVVVCKDLEEYINYYEKIG